MEELEAQQELRDQVGSLARAPPPPMKKSDTKDSISSVDSDVSLSFDRRGSKGEEADLSDSGSSDGERKSGPTGAERKESDSGADSMEDSGSKDEGEKGEGSGKEEVPSTTSNPDDFTPPDDELANKICAQVEFYFSDENIVKDAFLLKHVKRNKEGYVSLKLISSFKRVKHLSRDWRVVGAALARSKKLQVNELGTKLRRLDPLPQFDQTTPSRTVLVAKLPIEKLTVENVAELFKSCGEIALIRVLRPGHPAPAEVRQAIAKRPELANSEECALVEFTDSASARAALKMPLKGDAKVFELQSVGEKKKKPQPTKKTSATRAPKEEETRDGRYHSSSCASGSDPEDGRLKHKRIIHVPAPPPPMYPPMHIYQPHPYQVSGPPSPEAWLPRRLSACSISSTENGFILRRLSSCSGSMDSGTFNRRFSNCSSSSDGGYCSPVYPPGFCQQNRRFSCCSNSGSTSGSASGPECGGGVGPCFNHARRGSADCGPFIRKLSNCSRDSGYEMASRRMSSCSSGSEGGFFRGRSNSNVIVPHLPENVTRLPSGPDGTRGFGRPPRLNTGTAQVDSGY